MRRLRSLLIVGVVGLAVGFLAGLISSSTSSAARLDRVIAMSWGDGKYGAAFYGAHVYLMPANPGYSVRARVYIGRGNSYFHDCGELGLVKDAAEAVARWGMIKWLEDGLYIGTPPHQFFLARSDIENHR